MIIVTQIHKITMKRILVEQALATFLDVQLTCSELWRIITRGPWSCTMKGRVNIGRMKTKMTRIDLLTTLSYRTSLFSSATRFLEEPMLKVASHTLGRSLVKTSWYAPICLRFRELELTGYPVNNSNPDTTRTSNQSWSIHQRQACSIASCSKPAKSTLLLRSRMGWSCSPGWR
jgi:hypothetical protein